MRELFYELNNSYSIEEHGVPTINFTNEKITILSPDGIRVIIEENQVQVKFDSFTSSDKSESLSALFTPEKCLIKRTSSKEDEQYFFVHFPNHLSIHKIISD